MSRECRKRIEALEATLPVADALTIFRTFVAPGDAGPVPCEPVAIIGRNPKHGDQLRWEREEGECLDAFRSRVGQEAPRDAWGVCVLLDVLP